jgi:hypothetical protein
MSHALSILTNVSLALLAAFAITATLIALTHSRKMGCLLLLILPSAVSAQPPFNDPLGDRFNPPPPQAEVRYGPDATAALSRLPPEVAEKFSSFLQRGGADWFPSPKESIRLVAEYGPVVCEFLMGHAEELRDYDHWNAFRSYPLDIAHGKKPLPKAAAEMRERRERPWWSFIETTYGAGGGGFVSGVILTLLLGRRRARK